MHWLAVQTRRLRRDRGFALIVVLWIGGLLAVLVATLGTSARTQLRVAANIVEAAQAESLAEAGVALASLELVATRSAPDAQSWIASGSGEMSCEAPGGGVIQVRVEDQSGKIDINTAGAPLIQALLNGLGVPPGQSLQLAKAIIDFRDTDDTPLPNGAEHREYRAAGMRWGPKNRPLQSLDELAQVYGMTEDVLMRLQPHITLHTGLTGVDTNRANPKLLQLLRDGMANLGATLASVPQIDASTGLPLIFLSASERRYFDIQVTAWTPARSVFRRRATVDLGPQTAASHSLLSWSQVLSMPQDAAVSVPTPSRMC